MSLIVGPLGCGLLVIGPAWEEEIVDSLQAGGVSDQSRFAPPSCLGVPDLIAAPRGNIDRRGLACSPEDEA
ncbi:hypothetical protein L3i23_00250 [Herbiconiux sp. L3-i23]|nr:hypothetical protein L3i23_00250 [Herbiconiux sp. L3-i23]